MDALNTGQLPLMTKAESEEREDWVRLALQSLAHAYNDDEPADSEKSGRGGRRRAGGPERGRQYEAAKSPDGKLKALYRNRNLWLSDSGGGNEIAITTDGSEKTRIKYATASWVYGEELDQI